jgi:hypothetical protein
MNATLLRIPTQKYGWIYKRHSPPPSLNSSQPKSNFKTCPTPAHSSVKYMNATLSSEYQTISSTKYIK